MSVRRQKSFTAAMQKSCLRRMGQLTMICSKLACVLGTMRLRRFQVIHLRLAAFGTTQGDASHVRFSIPGVVRTARVASSAIFARPGRNSAGSVCKSTCAGSWTASRTRRPSTLKWHALSSQATFARTPAAPPPPRKARGPSPHTPGSLLALRWPLLPKRRLHQRRQGG